VERVDTGEIEVPLVVSFVDHERDGDGAVRRRGEFGQLPGGPLDECRRLTRCDWHQDVERVGH
jgi:hypothetical protein